MQRAGVRQARALLLGDRRPIIRRRDSEEDMRWDGYAGGARGWESGRARVMFNLFTIFPPFMN